MKIELAQKILNQWYQVVDDRTMLKKEGYDAMSEVYKVRENDLARTLLGAMPEIEDLIVESCKLKQVI